jgi:hypothetical protein
MTPKIALKRRHRTGERGQILAIAAIAMVAMIGGVSLILEAGNAYAHQRVAQNAADSVANAGAAVLAERLGGAVKGDSDVFVAMDAIATANELGTWEGYYTDVPGHMLTTAGAIAPNKAAAARVGPADGDVSIPPGAQGVQVGGSQTFGTTFARVLGINQFTASADATAVAGTLSGGQFLPVVFPVNIVDCTKSGDVGVGDTAWVLSLPDGPDTNPYPDGPEYIIPLCKTPPGSFSILDLDHSLGGPKNNCDEEVTHPPAIQFPAFPIDVASDNGNNCAKKMVDEVNALAGKVVLVPICDADCTDGTGTKLVYHIIRVAAFYLDYISDTNKKNDENSLCQTHVNGVTGQTLTTIRGNGSSSCMAGWFVRYVTNGPVGAGTVDGAASIGIQLIR